MFARFILALTCVFAMFPPLLDAAPMLSSKAVRTGIKAREIIRGSDEKLFAEAVSSLESILNDSSFLRLDPEVQVDMLLLLSQGYERLERFTDQEQFLITYAKKRELYRYSVLFKTALVRSYIRQERIFEAEQLLSKLAQPALAFASLEEKTEVAKTIVFTEDHLRGMLFSAETKAQTGLLKEALQLYKTVLASLEKYYFPFQASPVGKTRFRYALRLRISELYYLLGDYKQASLILSDWPEIISASPGMEPYYARRLFLISLSKNQQGNRASSASQDNVEYLSWNAYEAMKRDDIHELDANIASLIDKKKEDLIPLIHTLKGFREAISQNLPGAFEELEKALSIQSSCTALWRQASLDLFAEIGLQRACIFALSHLDEESQRIATKVLQRIGTESSSPKMASRVAAIQWLLKLLKDDSFHKTLLEILNNPENKLPDVFSSPPLRMYLEALSSYQHAIAGNLFEETAIKSLEAATTRLPDTSPYSISLRVDLLVRRGLIHEACILSSILINEYPLFQFTDPTVLVCMLAAEACPGFEKEVELFQTRLFSKPLSPQALFLTFRLFDSKKQWPESLPMELKDLLFSLERREEARNFLIDATKSKEAGFIKEQVERAFVAFSEAIGKIKHLITSAQKNSIPVLSNYVLSIHSEQITSLTKIIASPFAYNELKEKIAEEKTLFAQDLESYQGMSGKESITPSFLEKCYVLISTADLYTLAFSRDFNTLLPLTDTLPPSLLQVSECTCRAFLFAAIALHESHREDDALRLLSRLDETTIKDIHYELALEIALEKSLCLREKKHIKKAMALLAWIINSPCASSVRIKAMIIRAENYFATHREELAIKQLSAVVDKGGEWGAVAERKLLELYSTHGNSST